MDVDEEKVDDMVLALLYLTTFEDKPSLRAWKGHNWDALDRLHRKDYISDPATKAKSVILTDAGAKRSQELIVVRPQENDAGYLYHCLHNVRQRTRPETKFSSRRGFGCSQGRRSNRVSESRQSNSGNLWAN